MDGKSVVWIGCDDMVSPTLVLIHNQILLASSSEPTGSVPSTQSQKRDVGTIALWPHARAC